MLGATTAQYIDTVIQYIVYIKVDSLSKQQIKLMLV